MVMDQNGLITVDHSSGSNVELIRDTIRTFFGLPWFDLTESDIHVCQQFVTGTSVQALMVQLEIGKDSLPVPKFQLLSVKDLKRKAFGKDDQSATILFVTTSQQGSGGPESVGSGAPAVTDQPVQIRLVTDQEAVEYLSELIKNCSIQDTPNAYQQLERFVDRPGILEKLKEERALLLEKLNQWAETLVEDPGDIKEDDNDDDDDSEEQSESRELNRMAQRIVVLKTRHQTLAKMISQMPLMFRDVPGLSTARDSLSQTATMLSDETNQLFRRWTAAVSRNIRFDLRQPCIIIDDQTHRPRITLSAHLGRLAEKAFQLRQCGFELPKDIEQMEKQVAEYTGLARKLDPVVRFYMTVAERILPCQRSMLIDLAKAFTGLLETKPPLTWVHGPEAITQWIGQLHRFMEQFEQENGRLQNAHRRVLDTVKWMVETPLGQWQRLIDQVKMIMSEISQRSYQDTYTWRKHWDYQLYKILEYRFCLLASGDIENQTGGTVSVELRFEPNGLLTFQPSFETVRQTLMDRFQVLVAFPSKFRAFVDWSMDGQLNPSSNGPIQGNPRTLFHNIYYRNPGSLTPIYARAAGAVDELIQIRRQFVGWSAFYRLIRSIKSAQQQDLEEQPFQCKSLDDYQHNLRMVKKLSEQFGDQYGMVSEIPCKQSHLVVNIMPVKMFVQWLLNEAETVLLDTLRQQCQNEIERIELEARQKIEAIQQKPTEIKQLIQFENLIQESLPATRDQLHIEQVTVREKVHFLRSWSPQSADWAGSLMSRLDQLQSIMEQLDGVYQNRDSVLDDHRESLRTLLNVELETTNKEVENFLRRWNELADNVKQTPEVINDFQINCNRLMDQVDQLDTGCRYFQTEPPSSFRSIRQVRDQIQELYGKFHVLYEFEQGLAPYLDMEWIVCRSKLSKISQYIGDWIDNHPDDDQQLRSHIDRWRQFLSMLEMCRADCYQQPHWDEFLHQILQMPDLNYENLKLNHLWMKQDQLMENRSAILELNHRAHNDSQLREALNELNQFANDGRFSFTPYQSKDGAKSGGTWLIKEWQQCYERISDCFLLIQTIKNMDPAEISSHYLNQYQEWEARLVRFESLVQLLHSVQRKWLSLEPIYQPTDGGRGSSGLLADHTFIRFSKEFQELLATIKRNDGRFSYLLNVDDSWLQRLSSIDQNFTAAQRKLRSFLEESRQRFPRFYFLADEDLLLILSGKVDLNNSGLVKKLFANTVGHLVYRKQEAKPTIEAVQSVQGELISLHKPIVTDNSGPMAIERWLRALDDEIKSTLKEIFGESLGRKRNVYTDGKLLESLPSQVVCLYCYLDFTETVEQSLRNGSLPEVRKRYESVLATIAQNDKSPTDADQERRLAAVKIKQVVLDVIHFMAVVDQLLENKVRDPRHWLWQSQMRFYVTKHQDVQIRMGLGQFEYSFQYLGTLGQGKLVYTNLTNKCFLTLTQAMDLGMGGNPYGPAGTGKTETVKSLGQFLGRQVLVFNCDEAIDVRSMTRILVGLLKCGCWGCFDEFNRLQLDVLSVLSSQIAEIQHCIKMRSKSVGLTEYGEVDIDSNAAVFITMNPAGKEYGGRNRIPDNLRSLFLPVAMTVPDNGTIVSYLALSEGFSQASSVILGQKVPRWFEFAQGSMSQQRHYDWGLRTIKACLEASGRRLNVARQQQKEPPSGIEWEIDLVLDTLRQQIKSKLVDSDAEKFDGLVQAIFGRMPNQDDDADGTSLANAIDKVLVENNLIRNEYQVDKILQLYEQLQSRLGVILIGPSGSGKTTIWQMLRRALEQMETTSSLRMIEVIVINPKAMPRAKLLGYIDEDTRQWHDGLLTSKARQMTEHGSSGTMHWFVFDGHIEPDWVEALNSVLDDNRVLTLASGERIDFDWDRCRILFETTTLCHASPATISRLGVVSVDQMMTNEMIQCYVARHQLDISAIQTVQSYLSQTPPPPVPMSTARSLLQHLSYCQANGEEEEVALERWSGTGSGSMMQSSMSDKLILTESVRRHLDRMRALLGQHICLVGPAGVGKTTMAHEMLFAGMEGHLITLDCTPSTDAGTLLPKLMANCTVAHQGSHRVLRPQSGAKLWILIRHLELLTYDKWQCNSLMAMLVLMVKHQGLYEPETFQWLRLDQFQLVLTCNRLQCLDPRLLTQLHIITVQPYEFPEVEEIMQTMLERAGQRQLSNLLPRKYLEAVQRLDQSTDWNTLKIGIEILDAVSHYDRPDDSVVSYEIRRALSNYFGVTANEPDTVYTSCDGSARYEPVTRERLQTLIQQWIIDYCHETDIELKPWPVLPHAIRLVADLSSFLATGPSSPGPWTPAEQTMPTMMVIAPHGSGKKLLTNAVAHHFGYDRIWSPDCITSERHFKNELDGLLDELTSASTANKLLLLIDQIHLNAVSYLRDQIYARAQTPLSAGITVRLVLTGTDLTPLDRLMWLRRPATRLHRAPNRSFSPDQIQSLAVSLIGEQWPLPETLWPMFHTVHTHFNRSAEVTNLRSFNDLVRTFSQLYLKQMDGNTGERERLQRGVTKLNEVTGQVNALKEEAMKQKTLLDSKRAEADQAFQLIMSSMSQSEDKKLELEDVQQRTKLETERLQERKRQIDEELAGIEPILQAAKAAIGGIRSDSLSEIRSLRAPPEVIRDILEGVLRLMGVNDTSWVSMKTFLSRRGVKEDIMNFDCHRITPQMRAKVEDLLARRSESFQEATAKRASAAAAPLAQWVKANVEYSAVLHKIEPLERELKKLESNLNQAQSRINILDSQLQDVDTEVDKLRQRMQAVTVEAAQIEINLRQSNEVLQRSQSLVADLAAERQRWNERLKRMEEESSQLPFQCLVAAGYISQAGSEPSFSGRDQLLQECFQKTLVEPFDLLQLLNFQTEPQMLLFGSPARVTLVCDPTRNAVRQEMSHVQMSSFSASDWLKVLELGIRFGRTVCLCDFSGALDVRLVPLMCGRIHGSQLTRFWTLLGEKKVDYDPRFALYLVVDSLTSVSTTLLSLVRLINLSPSFGSVSAQLLGQIVRVKRPELERQKEKLDTESRSLQQQLKQLEDELLDRLSNASGNLLDDTALIEKLKSLKSSAQKVKNSLDESARLKAELEKERMSYDQLAKLGADLYFSVQSLAKLSPMYHFGYEELETLFGQLLQKKSDLASDELCQAFYMHISRALFAEDRRSFAQFFKQRYSDVFVHDASGQTIEEFFTSQLDENIAGRFLLLTAAGSDPSTEIRNTMNRLGHDVRMISMGSDVIAEVTSLLTEPKRKRTDAICLTNLHLVVGWLPRLVQTLTSATESGICLIMVTESCEPFPVALLEMCTKLAYELAPGLRAHLRRLRGSWNGQGRQPDELHRRLEYLHAICCERRFYVPFGWTKNYEFSFNEFYFAGTVIDKLSKLPMQEHQWEYLNGLMHQVIYGGKVDFSVDETVLSILLRRCFRDSLSTLERQPESAGGNAELSVLGLPLNADRFRQTSIEKRLKQNLQLLSAASTTVDQTKTNVNQGQGLVRLRKLWTKLLAKCNIEQLEDLMDNEEDSDEENCTDSRVFLEAENLQQFLEQFTQFQVHFAKRLMIQIGRNLQNPTDMTMEASLETDQSPSSWLTVWLNGNQTAHEFMINLARIYRKLSNPNQEPGTFDLTHCFHPKLFLNSLRQFAAHRLSTTVDDMDVKHSWSPESSKSSGLVVRLNGVWVEGARFVDGQLQPCTAECPLIMAMPTLTVTMNHRSDLANVSAAPKLVDSMATNSTIVILPLYSCNHRQTLLEHWPCASSNPQPERWIEMGVCLLLGQFPETGSLDRTGAS